MTMSKDRVRFTLPYFYWEKPQMQQAVYKAFGLPKYKIECHMQRSCDITIICRPSQFARFLIYRNELGLENGFKILKPELFTPEAETKTLDVSGNPHHEMPDGY